MSTVRQSGPQVSTLPTLDTDTLDTLDHTWRPRVPASSDQISWLERSTFYLWGVAVDPPNRWDSAGLETNPDGLRELFGHREPIGPAPSGFFGSGYDETLDAVSLALMQLDGVCLNGDLADELGLEIGRILQPGPHAMRPPDEALTAFVRANAEAICDRLRMQRVDRVDADVERFALAMRDNPNYSIEELRRHLSHRHPHLTLRYAQEVLEEGLEPLRGRTVDRMGREPNLLLAAHVAHALLKSEPGATLDEIIGDWLHENQSVHWYWKPEREAASLDIDLLRGMYPFIPNWVGDTKPTGAPTLADLDPATRLRLENLASIPFASYFLERHRKANPEGDLLNGARFVSVDHALANKFGFYHHLITHEGARQRHSRDLEKLLRRSRRRRRARPEPRPVE